MLFDKNVLIFYFTLMGRISFRRASALATTLVISVVDASGGGNPPTRWLFPES